MFPDDEPDANCRVLVFAPTARDGDVTRALLQQAGVRCELCPDLVFLAAEMQRGVGAVIFTDAALASASMQSVLSALQAQPDWSDIPVILLTPERQDAPVVRRVLEILTNATVLDRPVSTRSMTSAVLAALRARQRQYQIRDQLAQQRQAERALRQADKRKDEFLATLAHELRNPLAPIRTGLELLGRVPADGPEFPRLHGMMERQLRLLVKLIDDLMDVSRIATGKVLLQRECVDMDGVLDAAIEGSQPAVAGGRHQLRLERPAHPVWVLGDPLRLTQVVSNLIHNAAKYTPSGGHIVVRLLLREGNAVVQVSDDGAGIPEPMLEHVFDMFAQVDRTLQRAQGGLGIGLSLVRRLMQLHGGTVAVSSAGQDLGSTFTIALPATNPPATEHPQEQRADTHPARNLRVLVVDDNRDAADSLSSVLQTQGYQTRVAYSGERALQAVAEFQPEAIVCDIGLPEMDGHEVAKRVRADPRNAGTVLVAVTGWGGEEDKRRTHDAGFDFHLVKPIGLEVVQDILARL